MRESENNYFSNDITVEDIRSASPEDEDTPDHGRGFDRDSLFLLAKMTVEATGRDYELRVRNLSATGVMGDCRAALSQGDQVVFALPGIGEVDGTVAWCDTGRIGAAFNVMVDPKLARRRVGTRAAWENHGWSQRR